MATAVSAPTVGQGQVFDWFNSVAAAVTELQGDVTWIPLAFRSPWNNYGTYESGAYRIVDDMVQLRGLIRTNSPSVWTIADLPVGYRPPKSVMFNVATGEPNSLSPTSTTTGASSRLATDDLGEPREHPLLDKSVTYLIGDIRMSYSAQAQLSVDPDFIARGTACAAVEIPMIYDAESWTKTYIWRIAAAPGFADAYEYAINSDNPNPGKDPAVITDAMILGAVQALFAELNPPAAVPTEE